MVVREEQTQKKEEIERGRTNQRRGEEPAYLERIFSLNAFNANDQLNYDVVLHNSESEETFNSPQDEDTDVPEILEEITEDEGLRELAAETRSALVKYDAAYCANLVLEKLISLTLSSDLCMIHGATLAAEQLVLALH
ncbi:hypothetical protein CRYUN_Cryun26dG0012300 [Craigia yunnanensis]